MNTTTTAPAQQAEPATTANATQVGGNHYASKAASRIKAAELVATYG